MKSLNSKAERCCVPTMAIGRNRNTDVKSIELPVEAEQKCVVSTDEGNWTRMLRA